MPKISIIIPAYNAEKTILETWISIQNQTFSDWEVIVINDGSTDQTLPILQTINDPRLKVFSYTNAGLPIARNRGLAEVTGDYIAFLDADDLWTPDKLEQQLATLEHYPEAGVAYSWVIFFNSEKKQQSLGHPHSFEGNVYPALLLNNFLGNGSNPLVTRKAIQSVGDFDPTFPHCADWDYYLRLAAQWSFVLVPQHQILYRQSVGSMTSKCAHIEHQLLTMIEKQFTTIAPEEYQGLKPQSLAWIYEYCTQQYLEYGRDRQDIECARQKLAQAIRLYPPIIFQDYGRSLLRWLIKRWILTRFSPHIKPSI
ncbi:glycosyltransferase family 2 protein [Laspinema sp. A4]|uniref:glycosyltransferase family 2 protein n=1 Tax=Laspinema sp. D2d TaxID=2953686 RepID=UPI0021BAE692|nr:glycosyltransferase family A protein [Laspinema sp. D2d]MCT7984818.1 glycosyltransferase family 2 protein [Laspinema sp. D2d]